MSDYKSFDELTREQVVELKERYIVMLDEEGMLNEVIYDEPGYVSGISIDELARADELVTDDMVRRHYEGIVFTDDDFVCSSKNSEEVAA